jgi:hypothetical protein
MKRHASGTIIISHLMLSILQLAGLCTCEQFVNACYVLLLASGPLAYSISDMGRAGRDSEPSCAARYVLALILLHCALQARLITSMPLNMLPPYCSRTPAHANDASRVCYVVAASSVSRVNARAPTAGQTPQHQLTARATAAATHRAMQLPSQQPVRAPWITFKDKLAFSRYSSLLIHFACVLVISSVMG